MTNKRHTIAMENHNARMRQREIRNDQHQSAIVQFNDIDLKDKLLTIAHDKQNLPSYYPITFSDIPDDEIQKLTIDTLWLLYKSFGELKKREWKDFAERIYARLLETSNKESSLCCSTVRYSGHLIDCLINPVQENIAKQQAIACH